MINYPLEKAFTLIEPGPVVLITTKGEKRPNIMTLSWKMVLDFTPRFAICTGPWNYSFESLMETRECVLSIPTVELAEKVVEIGACSGREVDKFAKFELTKLPAETVSAPLIAECYANLECKVTDYIETQSIIVLDCVKAWQNEHITTPKFFHAVGDGTFTVDGKTITDLRDIMMDKLPPGV
ncbi:flavin reductase family protein [Lactovum odontotermitis]